MVFSKKGAQGIGTLIIFIALVLVAAVAAGVLIQTASALQSKSLDVGRQSQEKITTDIDVVQVFANGTNDSSIDGGVDAISIVARLGSGSSAVKLSDLIIKLDTTSGSNTYTANTAVPGSYTDALYSFEYIINGTNNQVNYLVEGDLVEFSITGSASTFINESESFTIRLVAKNGAVKPITVSTPQALVEFTTYLFP